MLYFTDFEGRNSRLLDLQTIDSFEAKILALEEALDRGEIDLDEAIALLRG